MKVGALERLLLLRLQRKYAAEWRVAVLNHGLDRWGGGYILTVPTMSVSVHLSTVFAGQFNGYEATSSLRG